MITHAPARTSGHTTLRVVLVDDHAVVRQGLRSLLESTGEVDIVGEAGRAGEAITVVRREQPDVVLLDLRLGDEDGMEVARECTDHGAVKVLVLSAQGTSAQLREALRSGADGYLLKGVTAPELVDALGKVAAGETVIDSAFVPALLDEMAAPPAPERGPVTLREMEVLSLAADGLTARAIARKLSISQRTVQKHLENLYRKMDVSSRAELVQQAFRRDLLR